MGITITRVLPLLMMVSLFLLSASVIAIPRKERPAQLICLTADEFSPIPAVKTTISTPPITAAYAPIYFLTRWANIFKAKRCGSLPASALSSMVRKSLSPPVIPQSPLSLLRILSICAGVSPSCSMMWRGIAGSISPQRVPMTIPSKDVKPMLVSTDLPPAMAAILEPLPKWHVMIFKSSMGIPAIWAALLATKRWDVP